MSGTTATYHIPYPTGGDELCAFPTTTQGSAQAIDAALSSVTSAQSRLIVPPVVRLSLRTQTTLTLSPVNTLQNLAMVPFDTVDVDTANMSNLNLCPVGPITPASLPKGWYDVGIYVHTGTSNANTTNSSLMLQLVLGPQVNQASNWPYCFGATPGVRKYDGGSGNTDTALYLGGNVLLDPTKSATLPVFAVNLVKQGSFTGSHATDQLITFACCWMMWSRDQ